MISIDPGVNGHAWALWDYYDSWYEGGGWYDGGVYHDISSDEPVLIKVGLGELPPDDDIHEIVIELPQVYAGSKSKGNPNDLIKLAYEAGRVVGSAAAKVIKPREWKGTIKKEVMLKRILSKLDDRELRLLKGLGLPPSKEHNVVDAIGIGLWALGRL